MQSASGGDFSWDRRIPPLDVLLLHRNAALLASFAAFRAQIWLRFAHLVFATSFVFNDSLASFPRFFVFCAGLGVSRTVPNPDFSPAQGGSPVAPEGRGFSPAAIRGIRAPFPSPPALLAAASCAGGEAGEQSVSPVTAGLKPRPSPSWREIRTNLVPVERNKRLRPLTCGKAFTAP